MIAAKGTQVGDQRHQSGKDQRKDNQRVEMQSFSDAALRERGQGTGGAATGAEQAGDLVNWAEGIKA